MTTLKQRLERATAFNERGALKEWAELDAGNGETWDWVDGAKKENFRLQPILAALIECAYACWIINDLPNMTFEEFCEVKQDFIKDALENLEKVIGGEGG